MTAPSEQEPRTLEQLLEAGQVSGALIIKGFSDAEAETTRRAYQIGIEHGRAGVAARLAAVEAALREIADVVHVVKDGPDGHPVILVRRPEVALDAAVEIARAALASEAARPEEEA